MLGSDTLQEMESRMWLKMYVVPSQVEQLVLPLTLIINKTA